MLSTSRSMTGSLILYSMPEFVLGILLLLSVHQVPASLPERGVQVGDRELHRRRLRRGRAEPHVLPWITLTLAYVGEYYLVMRSSLLDVLGEEYITLARAKGIREKLVLRRHAVRNALLPTVTLIALSFGFILGGAITVELVFSYPGVGKLSFDAIDKHDFPVLQGASCFFSLAVLVANLIADFLYGYLDPG